MKKHFCSPRRFLTSLLPAAAMLLLSASGNAQNINKHFVNVQNWGIDYVPSNHYILSGVTRPPLVCCMNNLGAAGLPLPRIQLEKIDANLNSIWFKTYVTLDEQNAVLSGQCPHLSVSFNCRYAKHTMDGGYILCGSVSRDNENGGCGLPSYDNIFLLKTDAVGTPIWYKRYSTRGELVSVTETASGRFIACGYKTGGNISDPALIIGTDAMGNLLWSKTTVAPAPGNVAMTAPAYYNQVVPYQGRYALTGTVDGMVYGSLMVTIIDDAGNFYQNAVVDTRPWDYSLFGNSLVDAGDGDLGITGLSGRLCPANGGVTGAQLMVTKLEPYSMTIKFLKFYMGATGIGEGKAITLVNGNKFCVTGWDWDDYTAEYAETDFAGNLGRFTNFNTADGKVGVSMTHNTINDIAVYSGVNNTGLTFVVKNDRGFDCSPDIPKQEYAPPYVVESAYDINAGLHQIDDAVFACEMPRAEYVQCGGGPVVTTDTVIVPPVDIDPSIAAIAIDPKMNNNTAKATSTAIPKVSPNPAGDDITITMNQADYKGGLLKIYDVTGRTVVSHQLSAGQGTFPVSVAMLKTGMYILKIEHNDGTTYQTKISKN